MAADEGQAGALYDFLYRDTNRLISYYAQIFQGKLTSLEVSETTKEDRSTEFKGDAKFISASVKRSKEMQDLNKRTIDPHDMNTADVLTYLHDHGFIASDYIKASGDELFLAKGKLFFLDAQLIKSTKAIFSIMLEKGVFSVTDPNVTMGVDALDALLKDIPFPPIYCLETEKGGLISGVVKESGMEELVSTYYFRYGQNALPNVELLGLKEVPESVLASSVTPFLVASQTLTTMMSNLLFPANSVRATPLAMFRKFEPIKQKKVIFGSASRKNKQ